MRVFLAERKALLFRILCGLIVLAGLWMGQARPYLSTSNPKQDIIRLQAGEVDYHRLYPELESRPTFSESFYWWDHPWRPDTEVGAYWRPLSMQAWWIQFHIFGEDRSFNWMRVSVLLTVLFQALLVALVLELTGSRIAAIIALAAFSLPGAWIHFVWPLWTGGRAPIDLLLAQGWKDQPDLFSNCLTIGAMMLATRNRYGWALACACIAVCFKESGMLAFPLLLIVSLFRGDIRKIPNWFYAGSALFAILMMIARWKAGPDVFYFRARISTEHWMPRYLGAVVPSAIYGLDSFGEVLFAAGVFGLAIRKEKRLYVWLASLVALAATVVVEISFEIHRPLAESFAIFVMTGPRAIIFLLVWLLIVAVIYRQRNVLRIAMLFVVCTAVAAIPYARLSSALDHVLVLAKSFQCGYVGCAALALWLYFGGKARSRLEHRRPLSAQFEQPIHI